MKQYIYADNAATTKLDIDAFNLMKEYLLDDYGNSSQPYNFSKSSRLALKKARETIAECINAEPNEIYFTSGGTESDNWALQSLALYDVSKTKIVTSAIEHHAILNTVNFLSSLGCQVDIVPVDNKGNIIFSNYKIQCKNANLVSIMFANNEIGTIEDIKKLSKIAHENGSIFHTDAVQAIGHVPINVKELGIDMLSASAHKFNGPKGIGFLYIKNGIEIRPLHYGGQQEKGKRAGTEDVASIVGMASALKKNCNNMDINMKHCRCLVEYLLTKLTEYHIDFIKNGSDNCLPGTCSISIKNIDGEMLLHRLDLMGISISTGSACDSKKTQLSHVVKAISVPNEYAYGTIRISLSKDNTLDEIDYIANAINKIVKSI